MGEDVEIQNDTAIDCWLAHLALLERFLLPRFVAVYTDCWKNEKKSENKNKRKV